MFGAYEFWSTATSMGIRPIIGTEAYFTPGTHRTDRTRVRWGDGGEDDVSGGGAYTHMTLLSETTEGMHNLFKMSSLSWLEGIYYKPRIDRELLNTYAKGLIGTSGCAGGEIQTRLRLGHYDEAKRIAGEMQEIDTSGILFICGGAFVGLEKIIQQRKESRSIGFSAEIVDKSKLENVYQEVTSKDIIQYGFIPEFIGRFGMVAAVDELSVSDLISVLREPKNSIIKQYQYIFELDGINLVFEDSALTHIAQRAKELKTNARGLKNIIEKVLLPYQFDAINLVERGLSEIRLSKDTIAGHPAIMIFDKKRKEK
jgi:hypothetical protein